MYERRAPWRAVWMDVAKAISQRSSCMRDRVGAVVVCGENLNIAIGYNGPRAGNLNCDRGGCPRGSLSLRAQPRGGNYNNCTAIHAEQNALEKYLKNNIVDSKTCIYITREPCEGCWKFLLERGFTPPQVIWSR